MPFQVIYSEFNKQAGVINSFSAGPDRILVCDLQVTLTATVNGDLFGHSTLWEQLTGDPVFWIPAGSPAPIHNVLVVEYGLAAGSPIIPPASFADRTFRFWIDKGSVDPLNPPQFDDVTIFGAPIGLTYNSIVAPRTTGQAYLDCNVPTCVDTTINRTTEGADCGVTTGTLIWGPPECEYIPIVGYQIEEYIPGSGFSVIATLPPTVRKYDGVVSNSRSYRILTQLANGAVNVGCLKWLDDNAGYAQAVANTGISADGGSVISNVSILNITLTNCDGDPQLQSPNNATYTEIRADGGSVISNVDLLVLTLTSCVDPQLNAINNQGFTGHFATSDGATISNYGVLQSDGSQIGG